MFQTASKSAASGQLPRFLKSGCLAIGANSKLKPQHRTPYVESGVSKLVCFAGAEDRSFEPLILEVLFSPDGQILIETATVKRVGQQDADSEPVQFDTTDAMIMNEKELA